MCFQLFQFAEEICGKAMWMSKLNNNIQWNLRGSSFVDSELRGLKNIQKLKISKNIKSKIETTFKDELPKIVFKAYRGAASSRIFSFRGWYRSPLTAITEASL